MYGRRIANPLRKQYPIEYQCWYAMKERCFNAKHPNYRKYGARGISVCKRWINSFLSFYIDMGPRPGIGYSLDRYPDYNGNYTPSNCRWATSKQQNVNKRNTLFLEYSGEVKPLLEWANQFNISYATVAARYKSGWDVADLFIKPIPTRIYKKRSKIQQ